MKSIVAYRALLTAFLLTGAPLAVSAQQPAAPRPAPPVAADSGKDWDIRIGAGALYQPEFEGSSKYTVTPLPLLSVNYRDLVFLQGPMLGVNAFTWRDATGGSKFQVGPLVRYQLGRDEDDSDDLRGMGDIDGSVEIGGFMNYAVGAWSAGLSVFRDVGDSHDGLTAKVSAGHRFAFTPRISLRSEIFTTWADDNYVQTFFGVTGAQSARSGLREYRPEGGFKDAGLTLDLDYKLTENWSLIGRAGYKRLLGDAADSPLVKDRGDANQFSTGLMIGYRF